MNPLKSLMALSLALGAGTAAYAGPAAPPPISGSPVAPAPDTDKSEIERLQADLAASAAARNNLASALVDFMKSASFVEKLDDPKKDAELSAGLRGGVGKWVEAADVAGDAAAKKQRFADEAVLRWILGAPAGPVAKRFESRMAQSRKDTGVFKYDMGALSAKSENWIAAFLKVAADNARKAYNDPGLNVGLSIDSHEQDLSVPGGLAKGRRGLKLDKNDSVFAFTSEQIYVEGGKVGEFKVDGGVRKISMKMITEVSDYGPPLQTVQKIGVYDVSDLLDPKRDPRVAPRIRGLEFDVQQNFESEAFPFNKDGNNYKLVIENGEAKVVMIKGGKPVEGGANASLKTLLDNRKAQADKARAVVEAPAGSNNMYIVTGGPGDPNTLEYWPVDPKSHDLLDSQPKMVVPVSKLADDKRSVILTDAQPLGWYNDKFYCVKYNPGTKAFDKYVPDGTDGCKVPPKPKPKPKEDEGKDSGGKTGSGKDAKAKTGSSSGSGSDSGGDSDGGGKNGAKKEDSSEVDACTMQDRALAFLQNMPLRVMREKPFTLLTQESAEPKTENTTYACVHGEKLIAFTGIIAKDGISIEGPNIVARVVNIEGEEGKFIHGDKLKDAWIKGDELVVGGSKRKISNGATYIIPVDKLAGRMEAVKQAANVASVVVSRALEAKKVGTEFAQQITVSYFPDERDFVSRTQSALSRYQPGTECVEQWPALKKYLDRVLKGAEFESALAGKMLASKGVPLTPGITFQCKGDPASWIPAKPNWTGGHQMLTQKDGKFQPDAVN